MGMMQFIIILFVLMLAVYLSDRYMCSRPNFHHTFYQIIHHTILQYLGYISKFGSYDIWGFPS